MMWNVRCSVGCNAHATPDFSKMIFNNVDFQLLLTQILHLNPKELRLQVMTWNISIKFLESRIKVFLKKLMLGDILFTNVDFQLLNEWEGASCRCK